MNKPYYVLQFIIVRICLQRPSIKSILHTHDIICAC